MTRSKRTRREKMQAGGNTFVEMATERMGISIVCMARDGTRIGERV